MLRDKPHLLFIHGGAWVSDSAASYGYLVEAYAKLGVKVTCLQYRLSTEDNGVRFPDHIQDCAKAMSSPAVSEKPVYLMGHSAGANMAAMLALNGEYFSRFRNIAGIVGTEGIYDIPKLAEDFAPADYANWFLNKAIGPSEKWKKASPQFARVDNKAPWLLFHSRKDTLVNEIQTTNFAKKLEAEGVPVTLEIVEGKAHDEIITDLAIVPRVAEFLFASFAMFKSPASL